jgi:hypothetical protein
MPTESIRSRPSQSAVVVPFSRRIPKIAAPERGRSAEVSWPADRLAERLAGRGESAKSLTERFRAAGHEAVPARIAPPAGLRDPDDVHVLACAVAVEAHMIVTGDNDSLTLGSFESIPIIRATEALKRLGLS